MKLKGVIFLSAMLLGVTGYSQSGGGGTGAGGTVPGAGTNGGGTPIAPNPGTQVTPQPLPGSQPPARPPNPTQPQEGQGTNQLGLATNQFGTNGVLSPTSQAGFTNRILPTNAAGIMTNANSPLMWDQAISESDQRLLAQIRAAVFGSNQAGASPAGTVHFILMDGAVRLVGTVPTMEERQRIENVVQKVPGVVRVYDALQVSQPGAQPTPR